MQWNPFRDVGYHHHWKLMTAWSAVTFLAIIFAFLKGWILAAVVLVLILAGIALLWLTIDPPDVSDEDVHGAVPKRPARAKI